MSRQEEFLMAVILIVEDDVFILEIAEMMIQDWGHQTLTACDVDEALLLLRSVSRSTPFLPISISKATVHGGCDLANQAIALRPKLRVLYTTGNYVTDKMKALSDRGHAIPSQAIHAASTPKFCSSYARSIILKLRNLRGTMAMADIALRKKAVSDIAASDIVETVPSALIILDRNLNITSANRAFYQTFRTSAGETEGCLIYELGNRQWDIPALRTLLESVIPHRASVEGFEVEHDFPTIGRRTMLVNARKIFVPATMTAPSCSPSRMSARNARPGPRASATGN